MATSGPRLYLPINLKSLAEQPRAQAGCMRARTLRASLRRGLLPLMMVWIALLAGCTMAQAKAKVWVTGNCVCNLTSGPTFYSHRRCTVPTHQQCTVVKKECVLRYSDQCRNSGGAIQQSTRTCSYGAKC